MRSGLSRRRQPDRAAWSVSALDTFIERDERSVQRLGKRDIPGVAGRQVVAQLPDSSGLRLVWEELHAQLEKILVSQVSFVGREVTGEHGTTKHVRHFDRHEMRGGELVSCDLRGCPSAVRPVVHQGGDNRAGIDHEGQRRSAAR